MKNKDDFDDDILDEADYDYEGLERQKGQQKDLKKKEQDNNDEKNLRQAQNEFEFSDEEEDQHAHKDQGKINEKQQQMQNLADQHDEEEEKHSDEGYEDEYEGQFEEEIEEGEQEDQNVQDEDQEREQENDHFEHEKQENHKVVSEKQLESQKIKQNEKDRKTPIQGSRGNTSNSVTRAENNRGRSSESSRLQVGQKNGGIQSSSRNRIPPSGLNNAKRRTSNSQTRPGMFRLLKMKDLEEMLKERDYQRANFKDIKAEHDELREKLRELNQKLNEKVESSQALLQKQALQEQNADKKVRSASNQLRTADAETENNLKIIKRLTEELSKYQNRITLVADPNYNNQLKNQIEASQNLIAKFKLTSKQVGLKNDQQSKELSKLSSEESTAEGAKQALQLRVEVQSNLGKLSELQKKVNEQEDLFKRKNELLEQKEEELQKKIEEARLIGVSTDLDNRDSKKKSKIKEQKQLYLQAEKNLQTLTKMYKTKEGIAGREIEELLKQLDTFDRSTEQAEEQIQQVVQTINARIQSTGENQTEILSKLQLDAKANSNNNNEESTTRYSVESSASSKPNMKIFRKGSEIGSERKIPTEAVNPRNDSQSNRKDVSNENGLISNSKSQSADTNTPAQNNQPTQGVNFHSKNKKEEDAEQDQSVITKPFSIKKGGNSEQRVWMPETNKIEDKEQVSNSKSANPNSPMNDESKALLRPFSIKKDETPRRPLEINQNKTESAQPNIFNVQKEPEIQNTNNQGENQNTGGAPPRMFKFKKNTEGSSQVPLGGGGYNPVESIGQIKQNEQSQPQETKESDDFDADNMVVNSRMGRGARRGKNETQHQQKLSQIEEEQSRVVMQSQQQFSEAPNDYPSAGNFPSGQTTRRTNQNIEQNPIDFAHNKEENKNNLGGQSYEANGGKAENTAPIVPRRRQNQENKNTFDYGAQIDGSNKKENILSQEPQANENTKWSLDAAVGDDEFASLNGPSRRVRNINSNNDVNINKNVNSEKVSSSTQHENAIFQEKQSNATNQPKTFNFQRNMAPPSPKQIEETKKEQASGPQIQSTLLQNEYQAPRQSNQIPQKPAQDPDDMKFLGPSDRRRGKKGIAVENTGGKVGKRDIFSGNDEAENQVEFGAIKELGSVREKENLNQDKNNSNNAFKNNNSQVKKSALDEDGEDESSGLDFLKKGKQKINYKDDDDDLFGAASKKPIKEQPSGFGSKKQDDKNAREKQMVQKAQQNDFFGDLM